MEKITFIKIFNNRLGGSPTHRPGGSPPRVPPARSAGARGGSTTRRPAYINIGMLCSQICRRNGEKFRIFTQRRSAYMEKIKARLNQLTRLVLSGTLDEEQRREVNAQLTTLRNLIATWRAYEGYDGEIDPDASSDDTAKQKRTSNAKWD